MQRITTLIVLLFVAFGCGPSIADVERTTAPSSVPTPSPSPTASPSAQAETPPGSEAAEQAPEPTLGPVLLEASDIWVGWRDEHLVVRWGSQTRLLNYRRPQENDEGTMESATATLIDLDEGTQAIDVHIGAARVLLVQSPDRLQTINGHWEAEFGQNPTVFPGDGTVVVTTEMTRMCRPTRRDLQRTRTEWGDEGMALSDVERAAPDWSQTRLREHIFHVDMENFRMNRQQPRWRPRGPWRACATTARSTQESSQGQRAVAPAGRGTFEDTQLVFEDAAANIQVHERDVGEGTQSVARVRWDGAETFVSNEWAWRDSDELTVRVVRLAPRKNALFVTAMWSVDEDAHNYDTWLFVQEEGALRPIVDGDSTAFRTTYNGRAIFPGDGTVRMARLASRECVPRAPDQRRWARQWLDDVEEPDSWTQERRIERILEVSEGRFRHARPRFRATSSWGRCDGRIFAACPFVDVLTPEGDVRVGEILRSIQYEPGTQSLALPATGESLTLRFSEEKAETTFLDSIHVLVDGVLVAPDGCGGTDAPAYCHADDRYFVVGEGESIELHFTLPAPAETPSLVATGYYESDLSAPLRYRH